MFFSFKNTFSHKIMIKLIYKINIQRTVVCMKKEFSRNTTEVFTKTIFHYIPEILKYIDEIKDPRKNWNYSMRYLFGCG